MNDCAALSQCDEAQKKNGQEKSKQMLAREAEEEEKNESKMIQSALKMSDERAQQS